MNRIYQGSVSNVEIRGENGEWQPFDSDPKKNREKWQDVLWQHHELFQDAVNYYLVALGSLADSGSANRVIQDLRARLVESWEKFPRDQQGAFSLRDSLQRSLPNLKEDATLQDAFDSILAGNGTLPQAKTLSLLSLLHDLGGDIQKGSKRYFPFFCEAATNATFPRARVGLLKAEGKDLVPKLLWNSDLENNAHQIVSQLRFEYFANPNEFVPPITGDEAKTRLREALENPQLIEFLSSKILEDLRKALESSEEESELPRYFFGGAGAKIRQFRLDLFLVAKHVLPHPEVLQVLRNSFKKPTPSKKPKETDDTEAMLRSLDNDPLIIARGERGFIFPSFTSISLWAGASDHEPVWREFDIAAFAEALKSLNQFNKKTIERDEKLQAAKQTLDYMLGKSDMLPKSSDGDGETKAPSRPGKDARWPKVAELEKELGENLNEGSWELSRSSMRGLRDIVELWHKKPNATTDDLQKIVKDYQSDDKHRREVGSVQLFLLLCEERYRELWRSDSSHHDDEEAEDAVGILSDAIQVHQLEHEIERFREPIRLTPAEPAFSRRLFMFSDLTDKLAKVKFGETEVHGSKEKSHFLETAIALKDGDGQRETRVRINFTAPRLSRDELLGGAESRWLQPMTAALGLTQPKPNGKFDSAVALMPDRLDDGSNRHLLNFPVNLDSTWIHESLGKAATWKGQFNGIEDKKNLHLHWPGTAKDTTKKNSWWENKEIIKNGFTVLSNDLGQRSAGAWTLLKVTCWKPETKRPLSPIGHDGTREWFAEVLKSGMYRLPGEDQKVQISGVWTTEKSGKAGRKAKECEYNEVCNLASQFGCESVENWLGVFGERSFPELNDQIIKIANRRLTRLGTYHRWSCFTPEKFDDPVRQKKILEAQIVELEAYQDQAVCEWNDLLKSGDIAGFRNHAGDAFKRLRNELEPLLVNLANYTVPLKQRIWTWRQRPDGSGYGDLLIVGFANGNPKTHGQRGLSMSRLEQLEELRRLFLRYNRSLDRSPGLPAKFGRADKGRTSGEPCQALLDKIDCMKEQRVNQTAHLILAQALGVTLRPHQILDEERRDRDIHGEYEKIAGREPVDFIVIEDLSRYLSSQGRAPSENSRLMKWAHRAIRDKLKMLAEEPFGIPVVETVPAYSSRFHAVNGQPGARLHELHKLDSYQLQSLEKLATRSDPQERYRAKAAEELLEQFQTLASSNEERRVSGKIPHTLYFPKAGGPLFLAALDKSPVQADLNAAINLGLRAIASPECIKVHRRVRVTKEKDGYHLKLGNAREKAAFAKDDVIDLVGSPSRKFGASSSPNFFYEPDNLLQADGKPLFDRATLKGHSLVSGVALWSSVNNAIFIRCVELNRQRIQRWKLGDNIPGV